jgi:hypothetical protein
MRRAQFQLDTKGTTQYISMGKVAPINKYDPNAAPGAPREQETDENGVRLWVADFEVEDGGPRTNVVGVRIAADHQPVFEKYKAVQFASLDVTVYVNKAGQLGFTYTGTLKQAPASATSTGKAA